MPYQTGKNVFVAYKQETTFNTAPTATGAKQFRLNAGSGLRIARAAVESNEVRSDGQSGMARLGSRSVNGTLTGDLSAGTFDDLFAAVLRGNWSGTTLTPSIPPVARSFTIETHEQDIDVSERFTGCRITGMSFRMNPDEMAVVEFSVIGADMSVLSGASAPFFTSPTLGTSPGLVATLGAITEGGVARVDFTALDFSVELGGATQPVIGSLVTPDVFTNQMRIAGTLAALRSDAVRQQAFLAETEFGLAITLSEPSPSTASITFTLPRVKYMDFDRSLGEDNAMIARLPWVAAKPAGASNMITITATV
jgi:hypothetical protein